MEETTALSVYNEEPEEFPVLKAFQQYIDAEQAKARQRMLSLSIFFGVMLTIVVSVFVYLLISASQRNQQLNDRLIDFVMKERDRQQQSSVIVQPQQSIPSTDATQQTVDNAAIAALTARLDEIQKNLEMAKQKDAEERDKARADNLEIERLKALLQEERDKAAKEREERLEAELEAYRRQHYAYYYEKDPKTTESVEVVAPKVEEESDEDPIQELLDDLESKDSGAIKYFDDEEDDEENSVEEEEEKNSKNIKNSRRPSWQIPTE